MPRSTYTCEYCGVERERYPSQKRRFCSHSCRTRWFLENDGGYLMPRKPKTGVTEPCLVCGTPVYRRQHQIKAGIGKLCSVECNNAYQARNGRMFTCGTCGAEYRLSPSQAEHQANRYCSKACEGRSRMKRPLEREHNGKPALQDIHGYVRIYEPDHPKAMNGGWVFEHRHVVEKIVGRYLATDEQVHHLNGVKDDNRPENLQVLGAQEHRLITAKELKEQRAEAAAELAEYRRRFGPL